MKVTFGTVITLPWEKCELCYIGPGFLYEGDAYLITFNLFFIEFSMRIYRKMIRGAEYV